MRRTRLAVTVAAVAGTVGCAGDDGSQRSPATAAIAEPAADSAAPSAAEPDVQRHPDVIDATATRTDTGWTISATLSSPYDSPERYADAWRVLGPDGTVLAVRDLLHDHAAEQPFTRSLTGVDIPDEVGTVTIEGRDQQYGWGGATVTIELDRDP